jgi:hypothetical protein
MEKLQIKIKLPKKSPLLQKLNKFWSVFGKNKSSTTDGSTLFVHCAKRKSFSQIFKDANLVTEQLRLCN